jgi:recombination protein RecA
MPAFFINKGNKMARKSTTQTTTNGKLSIAQLREAINKKAGIEVAYNLTEDNPTDVEMWIPTGSRWLDSIICKGKMAGIPVGKISEIAGLTAAGKSYMAAQIAANAQKMGIDVIYFDSESALDSEFLAKAGCDVPNVLYVQATTVEFVLETIEQLLGTNTNKMLFIWDSLAMTPANADLEGDFNPQSSMALKPRILAKGMSKLTQPIANGRSTLLVLNQLKTNITSTPAEALVEPYFTPGGKALPYSFSTRLWLTGRKSKASFVIDANGYRVGSEVKVKLKKSRFGTEGRECTFKILWGGETIAIQDEESWLEAIKTSPHFEQSGAWFSLIYKDGSKERFQTAGWLEKLKTEKFRERVLEIMDKELIYNFMAKEGNASNYYNVDDDRDEQDQIEES